MISMVVGGVALAKLTIKQQILTDRDAAHRTAEQP
jgi:hypothetical protein